MTHALGVYYAPEHNYKVDRDYIAALQPPVIRILDPDVQHIADMHALAPDAIIAPRTWAIDDNEGSAVRNLMADPIATGRDHAQQYKGKWDRWQQDAQLRGLKLPPVDRILFNSANEPNQGGTPEKIAAYCVAFFDRCTELGIRACGPCLGVGWPDNNGPDTPVDWSPYANAGLEQAIQRNGGMLSVHEYFYKSGPQDGWLWWAGRHLQCPFNVPILLGEIGIDNYVDKDRWANEGGNRGWQGNVSPEQYAEMIERHIRGSDSRVKAGLIFITDYRHNAWESFNTRSAHDALLARKDRMVPQGKNATKPPIETHLPIIGNEDATPPRKPVATGIIDPRVAQAILQVESGGRTHGDDGHIIIRFEAHIFRQYLANDGLWARHFRTDAARPWIDQMWRKSEGDPWRTLHTGKQSDEWDAFRFASALAPGDAAYKAISMGAAQIMGFNHARIGYPTAQAMFEAFANAPMQTLGFINFCLSDAALTNAIQRRDWRTIAKLYNGSGAIDTYAPLLERAYSELEG